FVTALQHHPGGHATARCQFDVIGSRAQVCAEGKHKNRDQENSRGPSHSAAGYSTGRAESTILTAAAKRATRLTGRMPGAGRRTGAHLRCLSYQLNPNVTGIILVGIVPVAA